LYIVIVRQVNEGASGCFSVLLQFYCRTCDGLQEWSAYRVPAGLIGFIGGFYLRHASARRALRRRAVIGYLASLQVYTWHTK